MELPFDTAIPLLGTYHKNPETASQKNLYTSLFIVVQFTGAKCWKQTTPTTQKRKRSHGHGQQGGICWGQWGVRGLNGNGKI